MSNRGHIVVSETPINRHIEEHTTRGQAVAEIEVSEEFHEILVEGEGETRRIQYPGGGKGLEAGPLAEKYTTIETSEEGRPVHTVTVLSVPGVDATSDHVRHHAVTTTHHLIV